MTTTGITPSSTTTWMDQVRSWLIPAVIAARTIRRGDIFVKVGSRLPKNMFLAGLGGLGLGALSQFANRSASLPDPNLPRWWEAGLLSAISGGLATTVAGRLAHRLLKILNLQSLPLRSKLLLFGLGTLVGFGSEIAISTLSGLLTATPTEEPTPDDKKFLGIDADLYSYLQQNGTLPSDVNYQERDGDPNSLNTAKDLTGATSPEKIKRIEAALAIMTLNRIDALMPLAKARKMLEGRAESYPSLEELAELTKQLTAKDQMTLAFAAANVLEQKKDWVRLRNWIPLLNKRRYANTVAKTFYWTAVAYLAGDDWGSQIDSYIAFLRTLPDEAARAAAFRPYSDELFNMNKEHLKGEQIGAALVRAFPQDEYFYHILGYAQYELKKYPEAITNLTRATALNPEDSDSWLWLVMAHRASPTPNHEQDKAVFLRALEIYPKFLAAWSGLEKVADKLYVEGNVASALECYEKLLQWKPDNLSYLIRKAGCLYDLNRFDEALVVYNACLVGKASDYICNYKKGATLEKLRKTVEAVAAYQNALSLHPGDELIRTALNRLKPKPTAQPKPRRAPQPPAKRVPLKF